MTLSMYRMHITELKHDFIPATLNAAMRRWAGKWDNEDIPCMVDKLQERLERVGKAEFIEIYKWYMGGGKR